MLIGYPIEKGPPQRALKVWMMSVGQLGGKLNVVACTTAALYEDGTVEKFE